MILSQLIIVLNLIGCEVGASFPNQSHGEVKQNQTIPWTTFDTIVPKHVGLNLLSLSVAES